MSALLSEPVIYSDTNSNDLKKLLVVEDDYSLREALEETLTLANYTVITAKNAEEAIEKLAKEKMIAMVISDINMGKMSGHELLQHIKSAYPQIPTLLMTAYGSVRDSVEAIRNGAVDYLVKPFEPKELVDIVRCNLGGALLSKEDIPVAEDEHSQSLLSLARKVAQSDITALIVGESGTGKEVLARYIHYQSDRGDKPFVALNCAAIPENMLEAMLFGYEKGAYTGAHTSMPGKFEQANGGTLLLDEISEMDIGLQAKLLRVLQEREVERLGSRKTIKLDVRVIATSNRDMHTYVTDGKFREDLFYRLSVFPLYWKPLRERGKDILPLAKRLLKKHISKQKRPDVSLTGSAEKALKAYSWPGNVRELDNIMQRSLILQSGSCISAEDLGLNLSEGVIETHLPNNSSVTPTLASSDACQSTVLDNDLLQATNNFQDLGDNLQQKEFEIIAKTLMEECGSRKNTAERLGISPRTLRYKLAKMRDSGIDY